MANYTEYRTNIQSGDLLMWETRTVSSFTDFLLMLVQKILNTRYSHVGIAVETGGRMMVLEADVPEVRLVPISITTDFYHLPLAIKWRPEYKDFLYKELGKEYSLWSTLKYVFRITRTTKTWYCSELAAYFYDAIGFIDTDEKGFTPKNLTDTLIAMTGKQPVFVNIDKANYPTDHDL